MLDLVVFENERVEGKLEQILCKHKHLLLLFFLKVSLPAHERLQGLHLEPLVVVPEEHPGRLFLGVA